MSRPARFRRRAAATALLSLLAACPAAAGDGEGEPAPPPPPRYGGVPEDAAPWRRAGQPAQRWFAEKVEFLGPGRDEPETEGLESVRVGLLAPLGEGPEAPLGRSMRDGAVLAVEEANAAGGHRGVPFALVTRDDLPVWGSSSNEIVRMAYGDRVWGILGAVDGASTHILLRVALKIEIPIVNTADTDPTLTETNIPWLLRVIPDDRQECYRLADHAFRVLGARRPAILRTNGRYGRVGVAEFQDTARRLGRPVVADLRFGPGGTELEGPLARLRASGADAILVWGDGEETGRVVRALREAGIGAPVLGSDRMVADAFLAAAGRAAEGTVAAYPFDPGRKDPDWVAFRVRFRERHGREADAYAAYGYDGARLLLEGIGKAGLNRVRIRDFLYAVDDWKGVTGEMRFDAARNNLAPGALATVRDGKWTFRAGE